LSWRWGLWAPRILQIPLFRNPKRRRLLRAPVWPSEPGYGGAKISGDPVQSVFVGRSGGTTTCEHSQELTPGLLELKATGLFESHTNSGGPSSYGSSRGPFSQSHPRRARIYERVSRTTLVYQLELFSLNVLLIWYLDTTVPGNVTMFSFLPQGWYVTPYYGG